MEWIRRKDGMLTRLARIQLTMISQMGKKITFKKAKREMMQETPRGHAKT